MLSPFALHSAPYLDNRNSIKPLGSGVELVEWVEGTERGRGREMVRGKGGRFDLLDRFLPMTSPP